VTLRIFVDVRTEQFRIECRLHVHAPQERCALYNQSSPFKLDGQSKAVSVVSGICVHIQRKSVLVCQSYINNIANRVKSEAK
jgi:hypothetical protein